MCTLPLLAGENIGARFVVPNERYVRRPGSFISGLTPTVAGGFARSWAYPVGPKPTS
jgi:hypothetical protein